MELPFVNVYEVLESQDLPNTDFSLDLEIPPFKMLLMIVSHHVYLVMIRLKGKEFSTGQSLPRWVYILVKILNFSL